MTKIQITRRALKAPAFLLQVADSFREIADAVLRLSLQALGMPGNAMAGILDDLPPPPGVTPASLLQASSYNSAQKCMHCALSLFCNDLHLVRALAVCRLHLDTMHGAAVCMVCLQPGPWL